MYSKTVSELLNCVIIDLKWLVQLGLVRVLFRHGTTWPTLTERALSIQKSVGHFRVKVFRLGDFHKLLIL